LTTSATALTIFAIALAGVALDRLPWVRIDRPASAFVGAVAMVLFGVLTPREAVAAIDWDTIVLLLGMMIIIAGLQQEGYTEALAELFLGRAHSARQLLVVVVVFTGVASAFLVNDAVVLVLTPLLIAHCRAKGLNPVPFLLAEAMASNIGGTATITGNPQNMLIGLRSGISYGGFLLRLLPVAVFSSVVLLAATSWLYRKELAHPLTANLTGQRRETRALSSVKPSGIILVLVVLGFLVGRWTGISVPLTALAGAGLLLAISRHSPRQLFGRVDWVLLLFFASLFVVVGGAVKGGLVDWAIRSAPITPDLGGIGFLHGTSLGLSQLISNVPYTVLMAPIIEPQGSQLLWLALASSATLAGNLTLIGAVANLIVAERAGQQGVRVNFWEFFKLGVPVTLLSLLLSLLVLWGEMALGLLA
jgi:Na+/H+ antiporter NhaD/arsenite permease-like protein